MLNTKLVLLRHGESCWNSKNIFTGWTDIDLSEKGKIEAKIAGNILKKAGYKFDFCYTSVLKRSIHTLWLVLDELDQAWLPVEKSWRLNERHYGALQGFNKEIIKEKYGENLVNQWRRSFLARPPKITVKDKRFPGFDEKYKNLKTNELPITESLENTVNRIIPYWKEKILPLIKNNKKIIIVAHGNSIRGIIKFLDNLNEKNIMELNIPTATPLIYEFDNNIIPINHYYLNNNDKKYIKDYN